MAWVVCVQLPLASQHAPVEMHIPLGTHEPSGMGVPPMVPQKIGSVT